MQNKTVCTSCEIPLLKVFAIDTEAGDFCPECCGQDAHHMSIEDIQALSGATTVRCQYNAESIRVAHTVTLITGPVMRRKVFEGLAPTSSKAFNIAYQWMLLDNQNGDSMILPSEQLPDTLDEYIDQKNTASLKDHLINAALSRGQA